MIRKVLQQGPSSLVISLPFKWVKQTGVKKGDEIQLESLGNDLVISAKSKGPKRQVKIDISYIERKVIEKYIDSAYKNGYSEIILDYENKSATDLKQKKLVSVFEIIQERAKKLIGVEVVSHESNRCIIKEVAEVRIEELDNIVKQVLTLTNQFIAYVKELIQSCNKDVVKEIDLQEDNIDKFIMLALRIINQKGLTKESLYIYDSAVNIESISDDLAFFSKNIVINRCKVIDRKFLHLYDYVAKSGELMQSLYFVFDNKKIDEFIKLRRDFYDAANKMSASFKEKEHLHFLGSIMNNMLNVVSDRISMSIS